MPTESQRIRLYQNAIELFYTKGFKATTMRDIASSMNFEAASLYNYIKSKDALLEELLFDVADQFLDGIKSITTSSLTNEDRLAAVIKLYVRVTASNPYKAALLMNEWRYLKEPALDRFVAHRLLFEGHLRTVMLAYFKDTGNQYIDVDIALHTFLGSTRWICDWYITQASRIDTAQLEEQLSNIILHGLLQPSR